MDGRHHPAIEADIERGWMSIAVACVLILMLCAGLSLLLLAARHHARNNPPGPVPSISTTDEGIRV